MSEKMMKVVIAGGGTAGWITASALAHQMGEMLDITLIESEDIGTIGVGEATIPPMRTFHRLIGINEKEFVAATNATFKLGIQFENWKQIGEKYFHSFGVTGKQTIVTDFIHFWLRGQRLGIAQPFGDYCLEFKAALEERFAITDQIKMNYAFHLDAGKYARFLRERAEVRGVKRIEGKIAEVRVNSETGFISTIVLESQQEIEGDLFIDCTGMRGLLIEQTLQTGYEEWRQWLPCDSAIAVQTESTSPALPYTRSIAHNAGWRWKIPLQHRVGNGIVYSSPYLSDDEATQMLLNAVEGKALTEPKVIKFKTGRRKKAWNKNCIAVGLSSGFLEPLESTSIHMIMTAVTRILQLFPHGKINQSTVDEYNAQAESEFVRIRDFIILHYKATERDDSPFWRYCKEMSVPEDLRHRMQLFKENGRSNQVEGELFRLDSWTQVMLGQGILPDGYHPIVDLMPEVQLRAFLGGLANDINNQLAVLPSHQEFIEEFCRRA